MNIEAIARALALFQQGQSVADPQKWKTRQIKSTMLAGLIVAAVNVAKGMGYDLPIDADTANAIAVTVIVAVNFVLTITTSKTVGVK